MLRILENFDAKYYVYDEEAINQPASGCCAVPIGREGAAENLVYSALKAHPLRTKNAAEAALFVIPLGLFSVKNSLGINETSQIYAKAFEALFATETFRTNHGNRHVIVAPHWYHFDFAKKRDNPQRWKADPMHKYYDKIWNVTWAGSMDKLRINKLYQEYKHWHPDYQSLFNGLRFQMSRSVFSIGLLPEKTIPFVQPTLDHFVNSPHFVFYHTKNESCWTPNSTKFRHIPLGSQIVSNLPPSSIGLSIDGNKWLADLTSSKFCLAIRGDNPQTHALNRALKAGCIPVVVSDTIREYAPSLGSSVDMQDYCIFIPEADFIKDPLKELKKLMSISQDTIQAKLASMALAQQVILPDHPQSLFVPAFIREALNAMEVARPETTLQEYIQRFGLP